MHRNAHIVRTAIARRPHIWRALLAHPTPTSGHDVEPPDPLLWRKSNPSFGVSVKEDDLARKAEKAIALPGAQNAFRRMHLNEWTEQPEHWIDLPPGMPALVSST
jgi:phage terminase large subunit-like protein